MTRAQTGHQAQALAGAVYAYAEHIDDLTPLLAVVDRISQKHAGLHITPPQYAVVGTFLLRAITHVLGADVFTGALYDAWAAAYWQLAHIFIARESALYAQAGWVGWKPFTVQRRVEESDEIASFYLVPNGDAPKMDAYKPGQFISVRLFVKELGMHQSRQYVRSRARRPPTLISARSYSLSDAPSPDHYRISVKRERGLAATRSTGPNVADVVVDTADAAHPGWLSNLLHDTLRAGAAIDVAFPFGAFVLAPGAGPVVLLAAGVGATPLLAMLHALLAEPGVRPVVWLQAARTPAARPFRAEVAEVARAHPGRLRTALFYSHATADVSDGEAFTAGRLTVDAVDPDLLFLEDSTTAYYTCGPDAFMRDVARDLAARGVSADRIHAELFGSGGL
jgi:nitric oxide dioxygenase